MLREIYKVNPKICVLVTFYNQEKYVDKALESIINQKTVFNIKILIGDDGSSDGTQAKIQEWIDNYPDFVEMHVMDRGDDIYISGFRASRNRLNLLKYVDTDYFIFLDGDDYYIDDKKLQKQIDVLENPDNSDCIACAHDSEILYSDGNRKRICGDDLTEGKYTVKEYWKSKYFHTDSILIRSSVIKNIDFKLVENNFNDNLITYIVYQFGNVYYIPDAMTVYLQTGDGIWTSGNVIVNHIRNIFLFDLCNMINPKLYKETRDRFSYSWLMLFKHRKEISRNELYKYETEARNKKLKYSINWINYNEISAFKKSIFVLKTITICWKSFIRSFFIRYDNYQ